MKKLMRLTNKSLLSALLLQFFFFQIIKLSGIVESWYLPLLKKSKLILNYIFGKISFSVGDVFYCLLGIFFFYCFIRAILFFKKKNKVLAKLYMKYVLLVINILYAVFMFSFGLLYGYNFFPQYSNNNGKLQVRELKIVAEYLLENCKGLRNNVSENSQGEFFVNKQRMIEHLYKEQYAFYEIASSHPNVKISMFSFILKKIGVAGYYNPFTGEAQVIKGIPEVSYPFTLVHEMGHQVGIASEDKASFYSFYMGESSSIKDFQYSVKYKALFYILREIYLQDSEFVKNILNNFSEKMQKDREAEKRYHEEMYRAGSDMFSMMNDVYLKVNDKEGIVAYNRVADMIVNYYKLNFPSLFDKHY